MIGNIFETYGWMKYQQEEHVSDSLKQFHEIIRNKMGPKPALHPTRSDPRVMVRTEATGTQFRAVGGIPTSLPTPAKYHGQEPKEQTRTS